MQPATSGGWPRSASRSRRSSANGTVLAAAISEPTQDLTRPATHATRTEDGWIVSGKKIFCTMSPAADVFYTSVMLPTDNGRERYGYAVIPRDTPGVVVHDDWDALGMRASGSNSVSFEDVPLPASAIRGGFAAGEAVEYMERTLNSGAFHAAAALGVAEAAQLNVTARLGGREVDPRALTLAAENVVDLAACRAILARVRRLRGRAAGAARGGTVRWT